MYGFIKVVSQPSTSVAEHLWTRMNVTVCGAENAEEARHRLLGDLDDGIQEGTVAVGQMSGTSFLFTALLLG